jgi:3-hydroxyacyl-CoA dehydrogenase/enoyl-CoA hydratase/3-hydroxybutyryl-CoA epimerase
VIETYARAGHARAAALEARALGELAVTDASRRLVEVSAAMRVLERETSFVPTAAPRPNEVGRVVVLGAGRTGAEIASLSLEAGLSVRLKGRDDQSLGRSLRHVYERASAGAFAKISATTDDSGMRHADLVYEAWSDDLVQKQEALRAIERLVSPSCVVATGASSVPVCRIAEASARPERVVGVHYARPLGKRRLLEIVRSDRTDPRAIATAADVGRRQGKVVIVVEDGAGTYASRVLARYVHEGGYLLEDGAPASAIDDAMLAWGFSEGPLHLLGAVGVDVASRLSAALHAAYGERMRPPRGQRRREGRGKRESITTEEIQQRCCLAVVDEALRCLEDGTLRSAADGDLGAILGLGFPGCRGGPFRWIESVGAEEALRRVRALEQRLGLRFAPAPLLVEMSRRGRRLYA